MDRVLTVTPGNLWLEMEDLTIQCFRAVDPEIQDSDFVSGEGGCQDFQAQWFKASWRQTDLIIRRMNEKNSHWLSKFDE